MRARLLFAMCLGTAVSFGCVPADHPDPEWMKPPKSYSPKTADLTFNEARLKEFNILQQAEQDAFVEKLMSEKGSFRGQAMFKSGAGLGEAMENAKYGTYELSASTEEVLWEITIDYSIFTTEDVGKPLAPNSFIEFQGTLVELDFQKDDKPRRLTLKVQADSVKSLKD